MNKIHLIKTLSLTSLGGLVLAGVLVFAVSAYDAYYDWLLIKQSLLLGLGIGLIIGLAIMDYQSEKSQLKSFAAASISNLKHWNTAPSKPVEQAAANPKKSISIWKMLWRGGLASVLGLLIGVIGGLWFCIEQYSGLSSSQQDWIIFYVPYYAVVLILAAVVGLTLGIVSGIVWGYFAS